MIRREREGERKTLYTTREEVVVDEGRRANSKTERVYKYIKKKENDDDLCAFEDVCLSVLIDPGTGSQVTAGTLHETTDKRN